jgi:hypothetical protein
MKKILSAILDEKKTLNIIADELYYTKATSKDMN